MATSTSHEVPFSSSSKRWKYDVFVSFRGKDTRKGFTGHLYMALNGAGINVFGDDDQLPRGTLIKQELMQAIKGSKISVIVFSRSYGDSIWCLEELVEILGCRKRWGQLVLPIFYDVDPTDVRNQTGTFGEAFDQKLQEKDKYQIQRWRDALTEAANLSGWELRNTADGHEAKFIKIIAEQIKIYSDVEIDSRLQDLSSSLREELTDDVHMIGIRGLQGTDKTTNGKSTSGKSHHGSQSKDSFLENMSTVKQNEGVLSAKQNEGVLSAKQNEGVLPAKQNQGVLPAKQNQGVLPAKQNQGVLPAKQNQGECEFSTADSVIETTVKPACKHSIEIHCNEGEVLIWEVRVVGWKVIYGAEFVPSADDGYTVILQKARNVPRDEAAISYSFKIGEAGKVVLIIDNLSSKKKKMLYRFKTNPSSN